MGNRVQWFFVVSFQHVIAVKSCHYIYVVILWSYNLIVIGLEGP